MTHTLYTYTIVAYCLDTRGTVTCFNKRQSVVGVTLAFRFWYSSRPFLNQTPCIKHIIYFARFETVEWPFIPLETSCEVM